MSLRTVLLSALARQFAIQGRSFAEMNPHDWLIWDSGTFSVPRGNIATAKTLSDDAGAGQTRPRVGDPLCFELPPNVEGAVVSVGRAEGNTLVLSDATVSRHHCTLTYRDGSWWVSTDSIDNKVTVDGSILAYGSEQVLSSGQRLGLGHLTLQLQSMHGMTMQLAQRIAAKR